MSRHVGVPDEKLTALVKTGDHCAFSELYNRYWNKLFVVAYHRINDERESEEIVQDVFLSLWKRRAELQIRESIATYLSVSVKYQIINRLAKQRRTATYMNKLILTAETCSNYTEQWLSEKELRQKLEHCILRLPNKCRLVFELSRHEGRSTKQIAQKLNIAEKTVEAHITKALGIIRSSLQLSAPILLVLLN